MNNKGKIKKLIIFIMLVAFLFEFVSASSIIFDAPDKLVKQKKSLNPPLKELISKNFDNLTFHEPINVFSDYLFTNNYTFPGNGSVDDPFIIENYKIITYSVTAIRIAYTNYSFIIRNCFINAYTYGQLATGIEIYRINSSAIIENCTIVNNDFGIVVKNTDFTRDRNITVSDNSIDYNSINGVYIYESSYVEMKYNKIRFNKDYGVKLGINTNNCSIHHNYFYNNEESSQGYDIGSNNLWYNKDSRAGNYWSDWLYLGHYKIAGDQKSKDRYPLNRKLSRTSIIVRNSLFLSISVPLAGLIAYTSVKKRKKKISDYIDLLRNFENEIASEIDKINELNVFIPLTAKDQRLVLFNQLKIINRMITKSKQLDTQRIDQKISISQNKMPLNMPLSLLFSFNRYVIDLCIQTLNSMENNDENQKNNKVSNREYESVLDDFFKITNDLLKFDYLKHQLKECGFWEVYTKSINLLTLVSKRFE